MSTSTRTTPGIRNVKLNRNSILKSCAELEAASRTQPAKKGLLMLDRLTQAQVEKEERKRMRQEATAAGMEYKTATIVRSVSAFTYDDGIKFARDLQDKHTAVTKQDVMLRRFLLEYDKTLIELQKFFGATDPVPGRDEVTDVQLVKTESGVLANFGKNVTEVYTALQGIRLPNGELKRLKNEWKNRPESHRRHTVEAQRRAAHDPGEGSTQRRERKADAELYQLRQDRPLHQQLLEEGWWSLPRGPAGSRYEKAEVAAQPNQPEGPDSSDHSHAVEVRQAVQPTGAIGQEPVGGRSALTLAV
jgi:hypothetical protein